MSFKVNPISLHNLLLDCQDGTLQLPDFQRSWVWDEERIVGLIASVAKGFPVGAVMTLQTGGDVKFKARPVEGAGNSAQNAATSLLLDGQQRLTSLYQVTLRNEVVRTVTPKKKAVNRWFYIDMREAIKEGIDLEDAIVVVPENRKSTANFGKDVTLDLSEESAQFELFHFPLTQIFDWANWQFKFTTHHKNNPDLIESFDTVSKFYAKVVKTFVEYQLPVISLEKATSKAAVCTVFDKVNTGGKALDAFELVTATFAADDYELRKDWYGASGTDGRSHLFSKFLTIGGGIDGVLSKVANTDFLHVVSLFHTRELREEAASEGKAGNELPQVTGKREALLDLPLESYLKYQEQVELGFLAAAKFLHQLHIFRSYDLPYQSQVTALAAILADNPKIMTSGALRDKLAQWYWNGVFGELYGSSIETRVSRDFTEVGVWLNGGQLPATVRESQFWSDRLKTMRMRLSAAYKGVNALLMEKGAQDFKSGQTFGSTVFFGENVDIHHIFPRKWCTDNGIKPEVYDSIINKSPLSTLTNILIGGAAPSHYL